MQRELKVNFPPIAVSKGKKEKQAWLQAEKITLALIFFFFLGDCPIFFFLLIQLDDSCLLAAVREKNISHFSIFFFLAG